jgi:hypothetical protein
VILDEVVDRITTEMPSSDGSPASPVVHSSTVATVSSPSTINGQIAAVVWSAPNPPVPVRGARRAERN